MSVIDQIYDAIWDEEVYCDLPASIAAEIDARSCVILGFDPDLRPTAALTAYFTPEQVAHQLTGEVADVDIWTSLAARPEFRGRVHRSETYWDVPAFKRTAFYNEAFRPFGDDTARSVGGVARTPDGFMSLAVHRGATGPSFTEENIAEVASLFPHVQRLLAVRERLAATKVHARRLQDALDQVAHPLIVLDAGAKVLAANRRGLDLLMRGDALRTTLGRVGPVDPQAQERWTMAVRATAGRTAAQGDAMLIPRDDGRPAYRAIFAPMPAADGGVLVILDDPLDKDPGLATKLTRMFGLTSSEAELAALLADGLTPEEAADMRRVRMSTVRTQIQRVLDKTETQRVSNLMRFLTRLPRAASH